MSAAIQAVVAVPGRFHAFDLARELHSLGALHKLITCHPKGQAQQFGVPSSKVASFVSLFAAGRLAPHISTRHAPIVYRGINEVFSRLVPAHLSGCTVFHGFAGCSLHGIRWSKRHDVATVVDRGSSHLATQTEIMQPEYDAMGLHFDRPPKYRLEQELEEYALADRIAVPSLFVKRTFLQHGVPEGKLIHAPFGTNLKGFSPGSKYDSTFRVVYAGHLSLRKGIKYLLSAFELARIDRSELVCVGSPTEETPRILRDASTQDVKLVGHVPQARLVDFYRSSSVFVMPSLEEGLAVVQAQALACGLPLICTTNSGGEDLLRMSGEVIARHEGGIDEFPAGYVVPIRDPNAIARCLRWLATCEELLASKRDAALRLRAAGLDWHSYAKRLIGGYMTLVGGDAEASAASLPLDGAHE